MDFDEKYFTENFFDTRKSKLQKGQVMARFHAFADLVDGEMKRDLIRLLTNVEGGGHSAPNVLRNLGYAVQKDSVRVCREMAEDLASGMSENEVAQKPYRFALEVFYYTQRECVPVDDPHWNIIQLLDREDIGKIIETKALESDDVQPA